MIKCPHKTYVGFHLRQLVFQQLITLSTSSHYRMGLLQKDIGLTDVFVAVAITMKSHVGSISIRIIVFGRVSISYDQFITHTRPRILESSHIHAVDSRIVGDTGKNIGIPSFCIRYVIKYLFGILQTSRKLVGNSQIVARTNKAQ